MKNNFLLLCLLVVLSAGAGGAAGYWLLPPSTTGVPVITTSTTRPMKATTTTSTTAVKSTACIATLSEERNLIERYKFLLSREEIKAEDRPKVEAEFFDKFMSLKDDQEKKGCTSVVQP